MRRDSAPRRDAGKNFAAGTLRSTDGSSDIDHARAVAAVQVCPTLRAGGNATGGNRPPGTDVDTADSLLICALGSSSPQAQAVAYGFQPRIARNGRGDMGDVVSALTAQAFVADDYKNGTFEQVDVARTITTSADRTRAAPIKVSGMSVRRLTPRECERLQGFPDDYTLVPLPERRAAVRIEKLDRDYIKYLARGGRMTFDECMRAMADGPRYKALGNSMAVPVMAFIGKRLMAQLQRSAS